jgi:hypothetical protein
MRYQTSRSDLDDGECEDKANRLKDEETIKKHYDLE